MCTINQTENNNKNHTALPDLGKAGNQPPECLQMHCEMHKTGNYTPDDLKDAAEQINRAGHWSKIIAGRIRVITINKYSDGTTASVTHWFKSGSDALRFFGLPAKHENPFDTQRAETRLNLKNYRCEIQDGLVIVKDPYHSNGLIAGYNEVIIKNQTELEKFFLARD